MVHSTEKSAENNLEDVFQAQIAQVTDGGFWPSSEDAVRLIDAFVCIRSPERREAVLKYALNQAKIELGIWSDSQSSARRRTH